MVKHLSDLVPGQDITCFISDGLAVYRQLGMWFSTRVEYLFVPARQVAFVVFCKGNLPLPDNVVYAYELHRPKALQASWDETVNVRTARMSYDLGKRIVQQAKGMVLR